MIEKQNVPEKFTHTQFPVTFQWSKIHEKKFHIISRVLPDSIGEELELEPGDALLSINGQPVEDVFDYRYLMMTNCYAPYPKEEWRGMGTGSRKGI